LRDRDKDNLKPALGWAGIDTTRVADETLRTFFGILQEWDKADRQEHERVGCGLLVPRERSRKEG